MNRTDTPRNPWHTTHARHAQHARHTRQAQHTQRGRPDAHERPAQRLRDGLRTSPAVRALRRAVAAATVLMAATAPTAHAATDPAPAAAPGYFDHPVRLVVPYSAGGPTDVVARLLGASMGRTLGQSVVVENRTGAGGTIAAQSVAQARPDGYTFLIHHNGMATAPALYRKLSYKPLADFEYVGQVVDVPMTLVGRPDLPATDFAQLRQWLTANAARVNLAHAGLGAVSQLCGMLLQQALGLELTTVPYPGTGPAMAALMGSQVDLLCDQTTSTTPFIRSRSVRLYGVTTSRRIPTMPDAPTLDEQGLKGFEFIVWHGVYAPKGTPKAALDAFGNALEQALRDPAVLDRLRELGAIVPPDERRTPQGLRDWLAKETARYDRAVRAAGQFAD